MSEQTHTAARPSRIFTVFPFDYPYAETAAYRPVISYKLFKKSELEVLLTNHPAVIK
jgi:hypothetical protein